MTIRLSGLASGMDTESMVKDLMKAERMRVDKEYQQKQLTEWKRDDYRDINTKLLALRTAVLDINLEGSFTGNTVESADESVLTATAAATAIDGQYAINVVRLASGVTAASSAAVGSTGDMSSLAAQFGVSGTINFSLEGQDGAQSFTFDAEDDNIAELISQINAAELGIRASYDSGVDRIFLNTTDTGSDVKIDITSDEDGFLRDTLKLYTGDLATPTVPVTLGTGEDAEIEYNGITGLSFSSNQFTLNNINFNLNSKGQTTISVSNDIDTTVEKIQAFVEAYNNAVELISNKLGEERNRDYPPLTDEQKEAMSDTDIELWQAKAHSGILRGDSQLNGIYMELRSTTTGLVNGLSEDNVYTSLSSVGIGTSSNWLDDGKLYIDEDKLRAALTGDSEGVMEFFTGSGDVDGLADRIYDRVNDSMTSITSKAGSSSSLVDSSFLGKEMERINERIEDWEDRLVDIEARYWQKFTAMETALQQLNNQSSWLEQQLASLG